MKSMDSMSAQSFIEDLTEADVLFELRTLLDRGFGRLEVVVKEGYLHTITSAPVRHGRKPHLKTPK